MSNLRVHDSVNGTRTVRCPSRTGETAVAHTHGPSGGEAPTEVSKGSLVYDSPCPETK